MTSQALHGTVHGKVQGVSFRAFVQAQARAAGLVGWARNLPDGSVEVWLQGDPDGVAQVATALRRGPPAARVERATLAETQPAQLAGFEIG